MSESKKVFPSSVDTGFMSRRSTGNCCLDILRLHSKVFGLFPVLCFSVSWAPSVSRWKDGFTSVGVCVCAWNYDNPRVFALRVFWCMPLQTYVLNMLQRWGIFWGIIRHWVCRNHVNLLLSGWHTHTHAEENKKTTVTHSSMKRFIFSGRDSTT